MGTCGRMKGDLKKVLGSGGILSVFPEEIEVKILQN
jgi:hypothetical protein